MYIKLPLIFVVFVLFVAVFLYSTMVNSLRPFLEEATSLVLFCHLLGFSDPTGPSSPKKKVEMDVKTAFRMLALRYHPDKNDPEITGMNHD